MSLTKAPFYVRSFLSKIKLNQRCRTISVTHQVPTKGEDLLKAFSTPDGLPRVRGRPFLPGSDGENIPETLQPPQKDFPPILRADDITKSLDKSLRYISERTKPILDNILGTHGCVLIKGLPLRTKHDFAEFYNHLGFENMGYMGGQSTRQSIGENILPASPDTEHFTIEPHGEMSFWPDFPAYFFLYCDIPANPKCGGESVFVDVRSIKRDMDLGVWEKMKSKGIRYRRYCASVAKPYSANYQQVFQTEDKKHIDDILASRGFEHEWHDDGSIAFWYTLPATRPHRLTGEEVWFNQATSSASYFWAHPLWQDKLDTPVEQMPYHTYYGDGSPIEPEALQNIRDVSWQNAVGFQMEQGDLVVLDNMYVQHARMGYVGERHLVVSIAKA